ncbi:MAG TPA: hypothetical protein VKP30_22735 [Polyangiaceae bacterium]|nr:hypothetical protein [Polyangiaceae bacterium]
MSSSWKGRALAASQLASRAPSESLKKVRRGETSLDAYLDEMVEQALAPFRGSLSADDLESLRLTLRVQISTDPNIVAMVRQLTEEEPSF